MTKSVAKTMVVIGFDQNSEPAMHFVDVRCVDNQLDWSRHHELAKERAESLGYEVRMVVSEEDAIFHQMSRVPLPAHILKGK